MFLILLLVLVLSAFDVEYFGIKLVYVLIPLTFLLPGKNSMQLSRSYFFLFPLIALLVYGFILRDLNNLETNSTILFSLNLIILILFSQNIYFYLLKMNNLEIKLLLNVFGYTFFILFIIDILSALLFGRSIFSLFVPSPDNYQLGQILTTEPNWLSIYIGFIMIFSQHLYESRSILPLISATLFQLLMNPSRIAIFSIFSSMLRGRLSFIFFIVAGALFFVVLEYWFVLQNPRYFDFVFIDAQITDTRERILGSGFGNIYHLTESMPWRDNYYVSNQLWLQVYINYGYAGLFLMLLYIFKIIISSPQKTRRIKLLLIFALQFHNSILMPSFWVLVALILFIDKRSEGKANV